MYLSKMRQRAPSASSGAAANSHGAAVLHSVQNPNQDTRDLAQIPDDDLALAVAAWLSPYVAADEVHQAWKTLTAAEKIAMPEAEFDALRALPTETIPQLIHWRDAWLGAIQTAKARTGRSHVG